MSTTSGEKKYYLRWTAVERWQHWVMAASFILLVITGFALKFPESWWAKPFSGFETRFQIRGHLHRIAATIFVLLSFFHLGYLFLTARGREILKALLPGRGDVRDVKDNLGWLAGGRRQPASFEHFSYAEKAEYWALVWGTVVMCVTGAGLWFQGFTMKFLPFWWMQIFTTIHYYEAWLASLAIVVWHFYAVIFNPEVYPLNTSMVTGWISEHHMEIEHGRELARIQAAESLEETSKTAAKGSPAEASRSAESLLNR